MKKSYKEIYRVECNFGSKYFNSLEGAASYFERKLENLDAELWMVTYEYCPRKKIYFANQKLLGYSAALLAKLNN